MDAQDFRSLQEAYMDVYQQLDEISLKTKMKAYAATQDPEADYAYGSKVHAQGDRLRKAIVKKHGEKAGENADAHADASHWGRKDASGKEKGFAQSRTDTPNKYRTRADGKMHGQDQNKLKAKLKRRIGEEYDIYNIILSHLLDEGYADTEQAAEAIMVNMSEDWRESIVEEVFDEALTGERYKKAVKKPGGTAYSRMVSPDPAKRATRGGRGGESDFGAGDRGSGNKAARRAGTYKDKED